MVRDILVSNGKIYLAINDISVAIHDEKTMELLREVPYYDFIH